MCSNEKKCCRDGLGTKIDQLSATLLLGFASLLSIYNDDLMVLIQSLSAIGSGTRGFQKAQVGSNERKCCRDGLGTKKDQLPAT